MQIAKETDFPSAEFAFLISTFANTNSRGNIYYAKSRGLLRAEIREQEYIFEAGLVARSLYPVREPGRGSSR